MRDGKVAGPCVRKALRVWCLQAAPAGDAALLTPENQGPSETFRVLCGVCEKGRSGISVSGHP